MPIKKITVLSGKGGVGKSSIVASLSVILAKKKKIICADCDVDAPDLALIFGVKENDFLNWEELSVAQKAKFDYTLCNSCGRCHRVCYFRAIDWINRQPQLKKYACEGCGACSLVCPRGAIELVAVNNAKIGCAQTKYGFKVITGRLTAGESASGKLVSEVKQAAKKIAGEEEIMLIDAAAGISCPVISSVNGSDYCLLAAEPTPPGLADLRRAVKIVSHFDIPSGIIINKFDINRKESRRIEEFGARNGIKIIGKIPYDKKFVEALVNLQPASEKSAHLKKLFTSIAKQLLTFTAN